MPHLGLRHLVRSPAETDSPRGLLGLGWGRGRTSVSRRAIHGREGDVRCQMPPRPASLCPNIPHSHSLDLLVRKAIFCKKGDA